MLCVSFKVQTLNLKFENKADLKFKHKLKRLIYDQNMAFSVLLQP